jgi:hypothetical protein
MVTVHLEMEPFSGPIDLSKTAVIIIDMQVRIGWNGIKVKGVKVPESSGLFLTKKYILLFPFAARFLGAGRFW